MLGPRTLFYTRGTSLVDREQDLKDDWEIRLKSGVRPVLLVRLVEVYLHPDRSKGEDGSPWRSARSLSHMIRWPYLRADDHTVKEL